METRRFFNPFQPQPLQVAVMLLYINGIFDLFFRLAGGGLNSLMALTAIAGAAGAYGMANEKKWGYNLGLVGAIGPVAILGLILAQTGFNIGFSEVIFLTLRIALIILMFHAVTKSYVQTYFK